MSELVLITERLELRAQQASDLDDLVALVAHEETRRFLGPARADHAQQFERLMRNGGSWHFFGYGGFGVRERGGDGSIIASCGVFQSWREHGAHIRNAPEAGWIVRHDWTGKGVAREAMEAVLSWFDAEHGQRLVCMIEAGNVASEKLAARLGFAEFAREMLEEEGVELVFYERGGG